jgi:hypothetical protein
VPIGLVTSSMGGTHIKDWSSEAVIAKCGIDPNDNWSYTWNAMMAPFLRMVLRGVIYYQGESDVGDKDEWYVISKSYDDMNYMNSMDHIDHVMRGRPERQMSMKRVGQLNPQQIQRCT